MKAEKSIPWLIDQNLFSTKKFFFILNLLFVVVFKVVHYCSYGTLDMAI